jgi:hypothetical protein
METHQAFSFQAFRILGRGHLGRRSERQQEFIEFRFPIADDLTSFIALHTGGIFRAGNIGCWSAYFKNQAKQEKNKKVLSHGDVQCGLDFRQDGPRNGNCFHIRIGKRTGDDSKERAALQHIQAKLRHEDGLVSEIGNI